MSNVKHPKLQRFLLTSSSMSLVEPYLQPGGGGVSAFIRDRTIAAWLDGFIVGDEDAHASIASTPHPLLSLIHI